MYEVPVTNDAAQRFTTQLGEPKLVFDIQWNDRSNLFSLTLSDETTQQVYFQGVPLVLGVDLLEPYNYRLGSLFVMDTTNRGQEANRDNFGDSVKLYWASEEEKVNAISSAV